MGSFSLMHWAVVVGVIGLLFGRNMISNVMGDVAKGIKQLRHINDEEDEA